MDSIDVPARERSPGAYRNRAGRAWAAWVLGILGALAPAGAAVAHGGETHGSPEDAARHERFVETMERARAQQVTQGELLPDLKELGPDQLARSIRYCKGLYFITRATGRESVHWEFNVRVKTDSSGKGPLRGIPVLVPRGSTGDRWFLIFAGPREISSSIRSQC